MGYYVRIVKSTAYIPAKNLDRVYDIMCSLNETHDHEKHGASWSGTKRTGKWFSWMDENYPETCKDAQAIFNQLGFETEYDDAGNLHLVAYDNKMGQEDLFLKSIATNTVGKIDWIGEDGETWSTVFKKEPSLAEFARIFDSYIKDIMNVNDPDEFIYSHKIKGSISVCTDDVYDDTMYEIVGLELDYLGGCGCPSGITIRVKKIED